MKHHKEMGKKKFQLIFSLRPGSRREDLKTNDNVVALTMSVFYSVIV